ncbi:MAG: hypothetical protein HY814_14960, partial [Candidatus Riflebacteria bacterium]|nr:hypothetical protein [Candidatus Riflebacteria bacterium]
EIASIVKKVTQIVGYASVFDPTNISKVVAIIGGVAAGGLLAHTTWDCGSYFFSLPRGEMINGARWAFDPAATAALATDSMRHVRVNEAFNRKLMMELEAAYGSYQNAAREAWTAAKTKDAALSTKVDRLLAADARIDLLGSKLETLALSDGSADEKAAGSARDLYTATQSELTRRTTVLADTLARVAGADTAASMAVEAGPEAYLKSLKTGLARLTASSQADVAALVSRTSIERKGSKLVLTAVVSNLSELDLANIDVRLVSGLDFTVAGGSDTQRLSRLPAGQERMLTWKLTLNEPKPLVAPMIGVIAEADGVNILPKFQGLDQ